MFRIRTHAHDRVLAHAHAHVGAHDRAQDRVSTLARSGSRTARAAAAGALVLAALAGVALASAAPSGASSAAPSTAPSAQEGVRAARPAGVTGTARIRYAFVPDDEIWFTVDARAEPYTHLFPGTRLEKGLPTDARGAVHFSHRSAETGRTYTADAEVDCLATGGPVATLTAVVTRSDTGEVGQRIGLSIYQGRDGGRVDGSGGGAGRDGARLGFSWGVGNVDVGADGKPYQPVVGTCMAPAPFAPVLRGGFTVHHTELEVR
ncbi:hypothetical protein [Kitasatospora sp. NPDC048538]|uniref:hypothetical protein n=1 Tax=unclassified Kitasatospora TaxID=2633591 RepID=UPI0033FE5741